MDLEHIPGVVERVETGVVQVHRGGTVGSGIVLPGGGLIATAAHVVGNARAVRVTTWDGTRMLGEVVGADPEADVAVLRPQRCPSAPAWERALPRRGEPVLAIGSPQGYGGSVTAGVVSGLGRNLPGTAHFTRALVDLIQTDAAMSKGSSGGALVNMRGHVVGMCVAFLPPQTGAVSMSFAVPAATVLGVAAAISTGLTLRRAHLGVITAPVTSFSGQHYGYGLRVIEVLAGSPAEAAGIRRDDWLTSLAGKPLTTLEDLNAALKDKAPGDVVQVTAVRAGEVLRVGVQLGERDA